MSLHQITIRYWKYSQGSELDADQQRVLETAQQAATLAYAPYSNYRVGAALLLEDGSLIQGCNQENASYPCGICAERSALFTYGASGSRAGILKVAVTVLRQIPPGGIPAAPCGLCRQVLSESERMNPGPMEILLGSINGPTLLFQSALDLLPFSFHSGYLTAN